VQHPIFNTAGVHDERWDSDLGGLKDRLLDSETLVVNPVRKILKARE
jgi:hypothetical protein